MGISVRSTSWACRASDAAISRVVGPASFARGLQYADSGAIQTLVERADGEVLLATVRGSGRSHYQTIVELYDESQRVPLFGGRCSCPMTHDCKHVAAVVLAARSAAIERAPTADWEEMLRPLVGTAAPTATPDKPAAALELSIVAGAPRARGAAPRRIEMKPLREGKTKRWVRTGASWSDLGSPWGRGSVRAAHQSVIADLLALHKATAAGQYFGYGNPTVYLDELGPGVWPLLRRAILIGMPLVSATNPASSSGPRAGAGSGARAGAVTGPRASASADFDVGSVRLLQGSARLALDVTRRSAEGNDSALVVRSEIFMGDEALHGHVLLLGKPAHGVGIVDAEQCLQLAALQESPSEALSALVAANSPITVPAADVQRFLDLYYPVLSRQVAVDSSDASVDLPEAVPPRLALDVAYSAEHRVSLHWGFVYGQRSAPDTQVADTKEAGTQGADTQGADTQGSDTTARPTSGTRVDLESSSADPPRDLEAEQHLLGSLDELQAMPLLRRPSASGAMHPVPTVTLRGLDTVTFTTDVLPRLRQREDLVVSLSGEPAAYAEAVEAPTVHVATLDPASEGRTEDQAAAKGKTPAAAAAGGADAAKTSAGQHGDWFDLQVSVTIAGEHVPFAPLFSALTHGEDVMLLESGTWFTLDRPELQTLRTLIDEARDLADVGSDTLRVTRYQVSLWEELVSLGVVDSQSERWSHAVDSLLALGQDQTGTGAEVPTGADGLMATTSIEVPHALAATLRPYQHEGYAWLSARWDAGLGAVLADDMGLGKTVQTLAMVLRARERGELDRPMLVVAPASVVGTWVDEAAKFAPDLVVRAIASTQSRRAQSIEEIATGAHVVVTSYTLLRLEDTAYHEVKWAGVVLDEAQFVKNHRSKTYHAVRRMGSPFVLAITGTPLENSLMDLWSMLSLAAPGLFPRPEIFTERYRKPIENDSSSQQLTTLRRRVRPFMLRRTKDEVAPELPPKQEQTQHIELSAAHRRIYQQHLQRERQRVLGLLEDMDRNRVAIFRALTALRQLALDPSLVDRAYAGKASSAKIDALIEQVQELAAEGHRALVFSSFTGFLTLVRERLAEAGLGYVYLDGRTRNRPERIRSFREGIDPVFLISLKAGGFGLTLTEADYVFVLDPWWNPAAESQAIDRTHRIGQTRSVMVYRMVSADTIEDKVVALQERKRALFATVVDEGEFTSTAITADDIRTLLDVND